MPYNPAFTNNHAAASECCRLQGSQEGRQGRQNIGGKQGSAACPGNKDCLMPSFFFFFFLFFFCLFEFLLFFAFFLYLLSFLLLSLFSFFYFFPLFFLLLSLFSFVFFFPSFFFFLLSSLSFLCRHAAACQRQSGLPWPVKRVAYAEMPAVPPAAPVMGQRVPSCRRASLNAALCPRRRVSLPACRHRAVMRREANVRQRRSLPALPAARVHAAYVQQQPQSASLIRGR